MGKTHFISTGTTNTVSLIVLLTTVLFLFILGWLEFRGNLWVQRNKDEDHEDKIPTNSPPTELRKFMRLRPAQFAIIYTCFDWLLGGTFYFSFVSTAWFVAFWVVAVASGLFELKWPRGKFHPYNRTFMVSSAFITWFGLYLMVLAYECWVFSWVYNHSVNNVYSAYDMYLNPESASYRRVYDPKFHSTFAFCATALTVVSGGLTYYFYKKEREAERTVDFRFFGNQEVEEDDTEMVHVENDTEKAEPDSDFVVLP